MVSVEEDTALLCLITGCSISGEQKKKKKISEKIQSCQELEYLDRVNKYLAGLKLRVFWG
jgi:stalled ribosome rescue protein Dom34